ncbi:hypothetical protein SKAU_G00084940 [Synaphobranchus kaupii]|uniref:Uncharacterized protein n=1 Tax=Synaphobranchus kaupii TaxID=118154 RepID=A0A9Q1FWF0_SYNKA|nr:hypothetical protein SKAU_G00084940 [Synaphobranchus kaupii]
MLVHGARLAFIARPTRDAAARVRLCVWVSELTVSPEGKVITGARARLIGRMHSLFRAPLAVTTRHGPAFKRSRGTGGRDPRPIAGSAGSLFRR